jgi:hypothetical protein
MYQPAHSVHLLLSNHREKPTFLQLARTARRVPMKPADTTAPRILPNHAKGTSDMRQKHVMKTPLKRYLERF